VVSAFRGPVQIPQLIEDDHIHAQQARRNASSLAVSLLLLQRVDQIHRGVEPHTLAVPRDARHADSRGQVRLARARPTDEHHVVRIVGERHVRQRRHQLAIYR